MGVSIFVAVAVFVATIAITIAIINFFFHSKIHIAQTSCMQNESSRSLTRRLIVSTILTVIVLIPALVNMAYPNSVPDWLVNPWFQLIMITPVMFYSGYPIHADGWECLKQHSANMNSLASLGAIASYVYSALLCVMQNSFPEALQSAYFELTGVIISVVLAAHLVEKQWIRERHAFPLQARVNQLSTILVPIFILLALWTFTAWLVFSPSPSFMRALITGMSVLIIACPCSLGWAAPLSANAAVDLGLTYGIGIQSFNALQQAQHINCIVIDATLAQRFYDDLLALEHNGVRIIRSQNTQEAERTLSALAHNKDVTTAFISNGHESSTVRQLADIAIVVSNQISALDIADVDILAEQSNTSSPSQLMRLSKMLTTNIQENLWWTFIFNLVGVSIAAGILYPFTGWLMNPLIACVAMLLSSLCVLLNSLRLRAKKL